MTDNKQIIATLKARIQEIDRKVSDLRCEQKGLEVALAIVLGESALREENRRRGFNG